MVRKTLASKKPPEQVEGGADRQLVTAYTGFVISIARRYSHYGVPLEDLISEGYVGLLEAASRYKPELGAQFRTYAAWWIRACILRYLQANRRIVRTPSTRAMRKLAQWRHRPLSPSDGPESLPSDERLAALLGLSPEAFTSAQVAFNAQDITIDGESKSDSYIPVDRSPSPEELAAAHEESVRYGEVLAEAMAHLTRRERLVLAQRVLSEHGETLAALAHKLGVSRERIRQIQENALKKIRAALGPAKAHPRGEDDPSLQRRPWAENG